MSGFGGNGQGAEQAIQYLSGINMNGRLRVRDVSNALEKVLDNIKPEEIEVVEE